MLSCSTEKMKQLDMQRLSNVTDQVVGSLEVFACVRLRLISESCPHAVLHLIHKLLSTVVAQSVQPFDVFQRIIYQSLQVSIPSCILKLKTECYPRRAPYLKRYLLCVNVSKTRFKSRHVCSLFKSGFKL